MEWLLWDKKSEALGLFTEVRSQQQCAQEKLEHMTGW